MISSSSSIVIISITIVIIIVIIIIVIIIMISSISIYIICISIIIIIILIIIMEDQSRVSTEVTFGRGDLGVCPLGDCLWAHELLIYNWRGVPQGSPQGQTLRALLLRGTSVLH